MGKIDGKLKVGSRTYDVVSGPADDVRRNANFGGEICYRSLEIWINTNFAPDQQINDFFHELVHAVFNEAAVDQPKEKDIERLASVLKQVIRDNPRYFGKDGLFKRKGA